MPDLCNQIWVSAAAGSCAVILVKGCAQAWGQVNPSTKPLRVKQSPECALHHACILKLDNAAYLGKG